MSIIGIDLGSRSVKIGIFKDEKLLDSKIFDTALFYREYCSITDGKVNVDFEKLKLYDFQKIVSTGYGRNNVSIENAKVIVELKAHMLGALWQTKLDTFILLDVGGQDTKVVVVKNGKMLDMLLNDKCAASCGRYLENMSNVLGISLDMMSRCYENPVDLSSMCAVFAESELIGKISEGYAIKALAAGVNYSLFKRIKPLLERFSKETCVLTGGVANNNALRKYIESELNFKNIIVPKYPELNGAIGCCVYGMEEYI